MLSPFLITIHNHNYLILPFCNDDCIMYEVIIGNEKLFILEMAADGSWKTVEADVMPANKVSVAAIGNAITKHYTY